jgi:hypothetical protein
VCLALAQAGTHRLPSFAYSLIYFLLMMFLFFKKITKPNLLETGRVCRERIECSDPPLWPIDGRLMNRFIIGQSIDPGGHERRENVAADVIFFLISKNRLISK